MIVELVVVIFAIVASAGVTFALATHGLRRGLIRRAPRISVTRASTTIIRREARRQR